MKKAIRNFLYLIIVLLVLEVIKTVIQKAGVHNSFSVGVILAALQMLLVLGFVFIPALFIICRKFIQHSQKAIGLAVLVFLLLIGIVEWMCAGLLHHPERLSFTLRKAFYSYNRVHGQAMIQFDSKASVYDPQLFYTLKPNARFRFKNAEFDNAFSINKMGLRDNDSSLNKPAVICLGDSYAMGWGVEQDSTFSEQLEVLAGKKVLNTGISSYGTAREIISLRRFDTTALSFLIVQYYDNDYDENYEYIKAGHVLKVSPQATYDKEVKSEMGKSSYFPGKIFLSVSQLYIKQQINRIKPVFPLQNTDLNAWIDGDAQARLFLDVLNDAPVNFSTCKVIVLFPCKDNTRMKTFEQAVETRLQDPLYKERFGNHVRVLKLSDLITLNDFYLLDIHLRSSGHRKIAQGIWNMMQSF